MARNIKKLLAVLGVTLFIFTVVAPMSSVFAKHFKYKKPYASVLPTDIIDIDEIEIEFEECVVNGENICGDEDEDENEEEVVPPPPPPTCKEDTWDCGSWGTCLDGKQTRKCKIANDCAGVTTASPATSQKCEVKEEVTPPPPPPEPTPPPPTCKEDTWDCGSWGTCLDGKQTRKCKIANDCAGVTTASPATSQKCEVKEEVTPPPPPPPPAPSKEDEMKKAAEEQAAKEALEKKKLEEELKIKEEEEKLKAAEEAKRLEELQKRAEEEALKRQEEELKLQKEEEARRQEEFKKLSAKLELSQPFTPVTPPSTFIAELQKAAGEDPVNLKLVKKEAELAVKKAKSVEEGVTPVAAERIFQAEFKKEKEISKRELIEKASERKFQHKLREASKAVRERGVSDEVLVLHGVNPKDEVRAVEKATFANTFEKRLFGVPQNKIIDQLVKPTCGLSHGATVATRGMAMLCAVPEANKPYELYAIDTSGKSRIVATQTSSENKKLVLTTSSLPPGNYALQLRPVSLRPVSLRQVPPLAARFPYFASTLSAGAGAASDPVLIEAKSDPGVPEPVVESIEGLSIAGLRDIQVEAGADGKITVSGASDITTMVIGTFSSAVFTSAMLADIDTGRFEVVSPRALEAGDHEVVIYASRPEEAAQSVPVKVKFRLIQVAKAEAPGGAGPLVIEPDINVRYPAAPEKKFPLVPFLAFGGLAVLLIGIGIFLKKSKRPS